jgi:hypothetical protein
MRHEPNWQKYRPTQLRLRAHTEPEPGVSASALSRETERRTADGESITRGADMWGFDAPAAVWIRGVCHLYAKASM